TDVSPRSAPPVRPPAAFPGAPGNCGERFVLTTGPGTWRSPSGFSPPSRRSVNVLETDGGGGLFAAIACAAIACARGSGRFGSRCARLVVPQNGQNPQLPFSFRWHCTQLSPTKCPHEGQ